MALARDFRSDSANNMVVLSFTKIMESICAVGRQLQRGDDFLVYGATASPVFELIQFAALLEQNLLLLSQGLFFLSELQLQLFDFFFKLSARLLLLHSEKVCC